MTTEDHQEKSAKCSKYVGTHRLGGPPKPPSIPQEWIAALGRIHDIDDHAKACRRLDLCPMCEGRTCRECNRRGSRSGHRDHVIDSLLAALPVSP